MINLELTERDHLRACPFCGGSDLALENTHTASYWIACNDCGAQVPGKAFGRDLASDKLKMSHHARAKASAINVWNGGLL
jgi:Lar family restriction alleviation protein